MWPAPTLGKSKNWRSFTGFSRLDTGLSRGPLSHLGCRKRTLDFSMAVFVVPLTLWCTTTAQKAASKGSASVVLVLIRSRCKVLPTCCTATSRSLFCCSVAYRRTGFHDLSAVSVVIGSCHISRQGVHGILRFGAHHLNTDVIATISMKLH